MKKKIKLDELIVGQETYPTWSTKAVYSLQAESKDDELLIYYVVKGNRRISRIFPKKIELSTKFLYVMGLLKGEGSNTLGNSNYRRFTITNSDPKVVSIILKELEESKLFSKAELLDNSIHILHHLVEDGEAIDYWANQLRLKPQKFRCFKDKSRTSKYGVCHVYISDVLLRRVIDLLHQKLMA